METTFLVVEPLWNKTAFGPACAAALSAVIMAGQVSWSLMRRVIPAKSASSRVFTASSSTNSNVPPPGGTNSPQAVAVSSVLYTTGLTLLRCVCCVVLLCLQVYTFVVALRTPELGSYAILWIQAALCATFVSHVGLCSKVGCFIGSFSLQAYVSILAGGALLVRASRRRIVTRHLVVVLLATWIISTYRNVWPLATYTLIPADGAEGWLLWIKYAFLTVAGVVVPLTIPREYRPYDVKVSLLHIEFMGWPYSNFVLRRRILRWRLIPNKQPPFCRECCFLT
jgi:hypothetical protein